jgi:alpha-beta hydrolase superfamily lysophospholipase
MEARSTYKLWKSVLIIFLLYIFTGITLYFIQDFFLFHPIPLRSDHKFVFKHQFKELNIPIGERNLNIIQFKSSEKRKGIVLYFHGNRQNVERYSKFVSPFISNGYEVWMPDYPGFGKSTGRHTEENMYADAILLYNMARRSTEKNIIIYGKSLGTGVASYLGSLKSCKLLLLETPYYSIPDLSNDRIPLYPAHMMVKYKFPIHEYLPKVKAPIIIFHGTKDGVIPYSHALRLKKQNQSVELVTIKDGKHNNLFPYGLYQKKINTLLSN